MVPWLIAAPAFVAGFAGLTAYGAVHPRSQLFGHTLFQTDRARKLALTFDDGPNPAITPEASRSSRSPPSQSHVFSGWQIRPRMPPPLSKKSPNADTSLAITPKRTRIFSFAVRRRPATNYCAAATPSDRPPGRSHAGSGRPSVFAAPGSANWLSNSACDSDVDPDPWRLARKTAEWLIERMKPIAAHAHKSASEG